MRTPAFIVAVYLALHLVSAHWDPLGLWGVGMLAYHPLWVQVLFAAAGTLLLLPPVRRGFLAALSSVPDRLNPWHSRASFIRASAVLACLALITFILLRSAAHLLGDGLLFTRELASGLWENVPRIDRAPLAFWIVGILNDVGASIWGSATTTYRLLSYGSGVLYVLLALLTARMLGPRGTEKTLILGILLTPGFVQLFFGYVENYPPLHVSVLLYLLLSLCALRGRVALYVPASFLGLLVPLHFTAATLVPSLLVLAALQCGGRSDAADTSWWNRSIRTLPHLFAFPIILLMVFILVGFHPLEDIGEVGGSPILPLLAEPGEAYHYGLLSSSHLLNVWNQMLLVAPFALVVLCLLSGPARSSDPYRDFLLAASAFPVLFTLLANPAIGAFRDWDVFSFAALPLTLWAATILIDRTPDRHRLAHIGLLACGAALLHTAAWVGTNALEAAAEARFARLLDRCRLSVHARSYGWGTLGMHYIVGRRTEAAYNAFRRALEADPRSPRHWATIGSLFFGSEQYQAALTHYRQALSFDPNHARAHEGLGRTYHELAEYDRAVHHNEKALRLMPKDPLLTYHLGNTYFS